MVQNIAQDSAVIMAVAPRRFLRKSIATNDGSLNDDPVVAALRSYNTSSLPSSMLQLDQDASNGGISSTGIVLACTMSLAFVFVMPVCFLLMGRQRRLRSSLSLSPSPSSASGGAAALASAIAATAGIDEDERRKARHATVESWLVSKRVHAHDEVCDALTGGADIAPQQKPRSDTNSTGDTAPDDGDDDEWSETGMGHECVICFEKFKEGEIVSWSPNPKCDHVYHHTCIKVGLEL